MKFKLKVKVQSETLNFKFEVEILSFSSTIVLSVLSTEAGTLGPQVGLESPIIQRLTNYFDGYVTVTLYPYISFYPRPCMK